MDQIVSSAMRVDSAGGNERASENKELKKACAGFESIFLYYMLKTMRDTVPHGGLFSELKHNAYMACFDQKIAEDLAKKGGGVGIQDVLFNQLTNSVGGLKNYR